MKSKSLPLILLGLLFLAAALGLTLWNLNEGKNALARAEEALIPLRERIEQRQEEESLPTLSESDLLYAESVQTYPEMPTEWIDGLSYLGILEIPSYELSLPVISEWNYERLEFAPCRYTGNYYARDLVICAHNYMTQFGPLLSIPLGTDVYFTNVEGETFHYQVSNRETLKPTDISHMIERKENWDFTLFTCNLGGQTRCAVRCDLVN